MSEILRARIEQIQDVLVRESFQRLYEELDLRKILSGNWSFLEIEVEGAVTNLRYPHGLSFRPTDIIQTSLIGAGSLTWNYSLFSKDFLDITTTDACTVRAFIGSYSEN